MVRIDSPPENEYSLAVWEFWVAAFWNVSRNTSLVKSTSSSVAVPDRRLGSLLHCDDLRGRASSQSLHVLLPLQLGLADFRIYRPLCLCCHYQSCGRKDKRSLLVPPRNGISEYGVLDQRLTQQLGCVCIYFVDTDKAKVDIAKCQSQIAVKDSDGQISSEKQPSYTPLNRWLLLKPFKRK